MIGLIKMFFGWDDHLYVGIPSAPLSIKETTNPGS
jgi:hypothetical protein